MNKDMSLFTPIKNDDGIKSIQNVNTDILIMPKTPVQLDFFKFNATAKFIFEQCTGFNSIEDIITIMLKKYANVTYDILKIDILNILQGFWNIGIITWEDENPLLDNFIYKKSDLYMREYTYQYINDIYEELNYETQCIKIKNVKFNDANYEKINLVTNIFLMEDFYYSLRKDNKLLISFIIQKPNKYGLINIKSIQIDYQNNNLKEDFNDYLQFLKSRILKMNEVILSQQNSFLLNININQENTSEEKILNNLGFNNLSTLKNEKGTQNILSMGIKI